MILAAIGASGLLAAASPRSTSARGLRESLLQELRPVALVNCTLKRFGAANDGGYLMCGNLLGNVQSAYSYGIGGEDSWGCQIARERGLPVHQYDCFDMRRPKCKGAVTIFHEECVGARARSEGSRRFDTVVRQISRNRDDGKRLVAKMDVEGDEWASLMATPDSVLDRIDQLAVEFHGTTSARYVAALRKLKRTFYLVHLHFNNFACSDAVGPFPAKAYQVLLVNKRIGVPDRSRLATVSPGPLDAPDTPALPDCQLGPGTPTRQR